MPSAAQIRYLTNLAAALDPYITGGGGGGGTDPEIVRDTIGAALVAGSGVGIVVSDPGNTITISADAEFVRDTIGTAITAGSGVSVTVNDAGDTITIASLSRGSQGTVDFGTGIDNDYAEVTIAATWVTVSHRLFASVRGGTSDHPLADEDAAIEGLLPVITAISAGVSITVGVHAPDGTWGQYTVDVMGAV